MNSLTRSKAVPQIRCCVTSGDSSGPFRYEANLSGEWVAINYQLVEWLVEDERIKREAELCRNSTCDTSTGAALPSRSSATTGKSSKSSSGVKAMSMTVCSLLSGSKRNSKGRKNEH